MAVPKKKTSKSRKGMRRSHDGLTAPAYSECPQGHEMARPHHFFEHCGYYKVKEVMEVEEV